MAHMLIRRALRTIMAVVVAVPLLGAGAAAQDRPQSHRQLLHYNHAYGVLDHETANAIEQSSYLREFANFEIRTTTGADGFTWTGRYLLGRETYLELFEIGDLPGQDANPGSGGMGISTEYSDDLTTVADRLRQLGVPDPVEYDQTRDFGDGIPVPWFDSVFTTERYDRFSAWAMEYRPEYFADPRSKTEPADHPRDVGRERYLSDAYREHKMRDVTAIRIAVTERDLASTVPLLRAGKLTVIDTPGGAIVLSDNTTIRFDVVPTGHTGLRQVELSLNRPTGHRRVERIGRSTLVVGPTARAVWTFGDPHGAP